ncbi:hypothetical protein C8D87_103644 [Lentzea atacamensis]|uniref:DUF4064 domain-containing protein n=1 Tax=Lentzea atacamensis TaxID=531938 RepID=A0ABX9EE21_9PSEU|nr:hypothetical protein C8D87_103644 [Lentzea atacamensis]
MLEWLRLVAGPKFRNVTTPYGPGDQESQIPAPPPLSESELRGGAEPSGTAPREVQLSFWLWIVGAALSVIGALFAFTQRDRLLEEARNRPDAGGLSEAELDTLVTIGLVVGVVIALLFAGLYVLFAFKARAGRNWARIVLAVLTALGVLALVIGGISIAAVLSTVVAIVAVVLLFLPASNQYFAAG